MDFRQLRVQQARLAVQDLADQWRMSLPPTDSVKLLLMLSGSAILDAGSGQPGTLLAGHIHLSLPGQSGSLWAVDDPAQANCRLISGTLDVHPDTEQMLAASLLPAVAPQDAHSTRWLQLVQLLAAELSVAQHNQADQAGVSRVCELLLIRLLAMQNSTTSDCKDSNAPQDRQIKRCLEQVSHHLDQAWSLATMAGAAGMSRSAFARRFQAHTGKTPMAYLNDQRVIQAKNTLQHSQLSVTEIADQLGYSTDAVFRRNFRRATGCSPSQFRNNAKRTHR